MPGDNPLDTPVVLPPDPVPPSTPHIIAASTLMVSGVIAVQLSYS